MVQTAKVLIGGGTGFVGRHLVRLLRNAGAKVRVITRNPKVSSSDLISWSELRDKGLPDGTTAVVNLAGRNILEPLPWTKSYKDEVYKSRIDTNRLLVDTIHKAPHKPKSLITISGVGYYAPSDTKEYDESWSQAEMPSEARCDYLMNLARDWEQASELNEQFAPSTRKVIIRAGVVIGNDGGVVKNMKLPFSLGLGGPLGNGNQWFPWIHVEDLAKMFKFAIINDHVSGVINGTAPEQVRNKDFASCFGKALNRPAIIPFPSWVLRRIFSDERADILLKGQLVKSRSESLGFRYQFPNLQDACNESLKK